MKLDKKAKRKKLRKIKLAQFSVNDPIDGDARFVFVFMRHMNHVSAKLSRGIKWELIDNCRFFCSICHPFGCINVLERLLTLLRSKLGSFVCFGYRKSSLGTLAKTENKQQSRAALPNKARIFSSFSIWNWPKYRRTIQNNNKCGKLLPTRQDNSFIYKFFLFYRDSLISPSVKRAAIKNRFADDSRIPWE